MKRLGRKKLPKFDTVNIVEIPYRQKTIRHRVVLENIKLGCPILFVMQEPYTPASGETWTVEIDLTK